MNSRFSRQWFCERKKVKAPSVYGGGALSEMISMRFGFRAGALLGIERVRLRVPEEASVMMESSSSSRVLTEGDEAVEGVRDDMGCVPNLRVRMTLLHNCLHTPRGSCSDSSSTWTQEQQCEGSGCASLKARCGTRFMREPGERER